MVLTINTDNNLLVFDRLFRNPIQTYDFHRHDSGVLKITFTDQSVAVGSRMIQLGLKPVGEYTFNNFLVYANSYVLEGQYYAMNPVFDVVAIQDLFFGLSANIDSVPLWMEARWSDDSGLHWAYSNVIPVNIHNTIFQGGELSSFTLSSFLDQIVPIMASWTHPINLYSGATLTNFQSGAHIVNMADNSYFLSQGLSSGFVGKGGSNYLRLEGDNGYVGLLGNNEVIYLANSAGDINTYINANSHVLRKSNSEFRVEGVNSGFKSLSTNSYVEVGGLSSKITTLNDSSPIWTQGVNSPVYTVQSDIYALNGNIQTYGVSGYFITNASDSGVIMKGINSKVLFQNTGSIVFEGLSSQIRMASADNSIIFENSGGKVGMLGQNSIIYTGNTGSRIETQAANSVIQTTAVNSPIRTLSAGSSITTSGAGSDIATLGGGSIHADNGGTIYTSGAGGVIQTLLSASHIQTVGLSSRIQTMGAASPVVLNGVGSQFISNGLSGGMVINGNNSNIYIAGSGSNILIALTGNRVGIGTDTPTQALDINSNVLRLRNPRTPTNGDGLNVGAIMWDSSRLYIKIGPAQYGYINLTNLP